MTKISDNVVKDCQENQEPFFVFRAKDIFTLQVLAYYLDLIEKFGPTNLDFEQDIVEQVNLIREWQKNNMGKVRYPD